MRVVVKELMRKISSLQKNYLPPYIFRNRLFVYVHKILLPTLSWEWKLLVKYTKSNPYQKCPNRIHASLIGSSGTPPLPSPLPQGLGGRYFVACRLFFLLRFFFFTQDMGGHGPLGLLHWYCRFHDVHVRITDVQAIMISDAPNK